MLRPASSAVRLIACSVHCNCDANIARSEVSSFLWRCHNILSHSVEVDETYYSLTVFLAQARLVTASYIDRAVEKEDCKDCYKAQH